jgi:hypothetical protein
MRWGWRGVHCEKVLNELDLRAPASPTARTAHGWHAVAGPDPDPASRAVRIGHSSSSGSDGLRKPYDRPRHRRGSSFTSRRESPTSRSARQGSARSAVIQAAALPCRAARRRRAALVLVQMLLVAMAPAEPGGPRRSPASSARKPAGR